MRPYTPQTSSDLLTQLKDFDPWLESLGIKPRPEDRYHQAQRVVVDERRVFEDAKKSGVQARARDLSPGVKKLSKGLESSPRFQAVKDDDPTGITNMFATYTNALSEMLEFSEIFRAFKDEAPTGALIGKMRRALKGPFHPGLEGQNSSDGRNVMFELSLAAGQRLAGREVIIGEPDIVTWVEGAPLVVECKRPSTWERARRYLLEAKHQLTEERLNAVSQTALGVVAISVSGIIGPEFYGGREDMLHADDMQQGIEKVDELHRRKDAEQLLPPWMKLQPSGRIRAVMSHLSLPIDVGGGGHFLLRLKLNTYNCLGQIYEEPRPLSPAGGDR